MEKPLLFPSHPLPHTASPLRPSAAPPMWDGVLHESHNILSLHRNGFLSVSSSVLQWLPQLHLLPVLYEWWQGATGFHWDLIKCEGPCGCSLIERRFNRAAQGRLIHQPTTIQRALGYRWQWWRARWLTQWRCVCVCVYMHTCVNSWMCRCNSMRAVNYVSPCFNPGFKMSYVWQYGNLISDKSGNIVIWHQMRPSRTRQQQQSAWLMKIGVCITVLSLTENDQLSLIQIGRHSYFLCAVMMPTANMFYPVS